MPPLLARVAATPVVAPVVVRFVMFTPVAARVPPLNTKFCLAPVPWPPDRLPALSNLPEPDRVKVVVPEPSFFAQSAKPPVPALNVPPESV